MCIPPRARSGYTVHTHRNTHTHTHTHTNMLTQTHTFSVYGESQDQLGKRDLCIKQLVASNFCYVHTKIFKGLDSERVPKVL